ncbi:MAG: hypothetical protein U9P61_02735 [Patescibacteria group bacterium]|nr:hypothetical protein [Patescibacteria group bacterium]
MLPLENKKILTKNQIELLPTVRIFMDNFGLVGGTAIAFHLGHRRSIDFDLFSLNEFNNKKIRDLVKKKGWNIERVFKDENGQFTFFINKVQMTFFYYPFEIKFEKEFEELKMPDLLTLGAMKAYALGRRAKWKDYVDLYFIFQKYKSIKPLIKKTEEIFKNEFNEALFRKQLVYFNDINYEEEVEFLSGFEVSEERIKEELTNFSLE